MSAQWKRRKKRWRRRNRRRKKKDDGKEEEKIMKRRNRGRIRRKLFGDVEEEKDKRGSEGERECRSVRYVYKRRRRKWESHAKISKRGLFCNEVYSSYSQLSLFSSATSPEEGGKDEHEGRGSGGRRRRMK